MENKEEEFRSAILGKKVPILTLDNKWYKLFENIVDQPELEINIKELNELMKRQGKINTETKDIKLLKKKLMSEIIPIVDEFEHSNDNKLEKKIDDYKRLIEECNQKLAEYEDVIIDIPHEIKEKNSELMIKTMDYCYNKMKDNENEIEEISEWILEIRAELKKKLICKREKEFKNQQIYAYMHDIFGAEVINLFDMKYNPTEENKKQDEKTVEN